MKVFLMVEWLLGFPNLTNFLFLEGNTHGCVVGQGRRHLPREEALFQH